MFTLRVWSDFPPTTWSYNLSPAAPRGLFSLPIANRQQATIARRAKHPRPILSKRTEPRPSDLRSGFSLPDGFSAPDLVAPPKAS